MSPEHQLKHTLEIAHVLFMDIVGYSTLSMDLQRDFLQRLMDIVRGTTQSLLPESAEQLIRLPTGDGMALVFFGDAESAPRCAVEISRSLRSHPELHLRMGLHSGPVYRIADINTQMNVAGGGINTAQRVMDCGDGGHVLISKSVADVLGQVSAWVNCLHDLGEAEVKHGVRIHVFNLYGTDFGNPNTPQKLRRPSKSLTPAKEHVLPEQPQPPIVGYASAEPLRFALLYRRDTHPDESVLKFLEGELRARGHKVFIDRHISIGVEWAKEIERQVRESDAVVPLISPASINSELLAYEVQVAYEASQQTGKPRILPVRLNFDGLVPPPLGPILAPIQYFLWTGESCNEALVADIVSALSLPESEPVISETFKGAGGAVPLNAKHYVERPTDGEFLSAIRGRDSIVLIKGARQMGKTSLLARGVQQARRDGSTVILTDFQVFNAAQLSSIDAFLQATAHLIGDQLGLDVSPGEDWHPHRGASINFARFMRRQVLARLSTPLLWAMDEVDRLFTCDFGSEVFGLFRSWHNERALDPGSPWAMLTLAIVYATEAHLFITDPNQSPFNVGTRLELRDFTFEQVAELNRRLREPLQSQQELARYYRLVGGHPYLLHRGLVDMKAQGMTLTAFEVVASRDEGPFGDHLRRILLLLARDPALCDVVRGVLLGQPCPSAESFYRLRSAGVISGDSARNAKPRCQLYATYLEQHLL